MEKNRDNPNNTLSQDYLQSCYEELVVAMLELTMKDLIVPEKKKKSYKRSAYRFVMSEWFEDLCWYIGVEPDLIRRYAIERYNESKKK